MSSSCPDNTVIVWKRILVHLKLLMQCGRYFTNSSELIHSVSSHYQYILGENKVKIFPSCHILINSMVLRRIRWPCAASACQSSHGWINSYFLELMMSAGNLHLFFHSKLKINTAMDWCGGFFMLFWFWGFFCFAISPPTPLSLVSFCEESLRPICSTGDVRKAAVYAYTVDAFSADGSYN